MAGEWDKVNSLFLRALEVDPRERPQFLAKVCGDDQTLRREIESLLASHERASQFLEQPLIDPAPPARQQSDDSPTETNAESDDLIGRQIASYRIEARLGAGGMGEVYKARDLKLDRPVALKVLSAPLTLDPQRLRRSRVEARAASSLNHPHIVVVHDFGQDGGRPFMVTEYVEGETLRERLRRGPLPILELVDIAVQISSALAAAHERGVLHRDIKPENIMVRPDGYVKVLDFGIAKLILPDESGTSTHSQTAEGLIIGTPKYMSPEQARGGRVDFRSDQFSFGVLLYELATGRAPFARTSAIETASAVITEEPEPLDRACPHMPMMLRRIIEQCLAKNTDERYKTTRDLHRDLVTVQKQSGEIQEPASLHQRGGERRPPPETSAHGGVAARRPFHRRRAVMVAVVALAIIAATAIYVGNRWRSTTRASIESLAVLPLENLSGDKDQEYFTDGMTDALISELAQIQGLKVISRTSIMQYKGVKQSLPDIGRALRVDTIVQGSVRRSGDHVAVSVQLIRASDDTHMWTGTYEEDLRDVLALHRDVARTIAKQLRAEIEPENPAALPRTSRVDPQVYDSYVRGRFFWNRRTPDSLQAALQHFNRALEHDPTYAPAYAGVADTHFYSGYAFGRVPPGEAMPRARKAADMALKLDPNLAEAHTSSALISMMYDWDRPKAEQSFKKAIALNPSYATSYHGYAVLLTTWGGRAEEAVRIIRRGLEVDPLSLPINHMAGDVLARAGRGDEAFAQLRRVLDLDPNYVMSRGALAHYYDGQGMRQEALAELQRVWELTGVKPEIVNLNREAYERGGMRALHELELKRLIPAWDGWHVNAFTISLRAAGLGHTNLAFDWLDRVVDARSGMIIWLPAATEFDGLRTHPRYLAVLGRIAEPVKEAGAAAK